MTSLFFLFSIIAALLLSNNKNGRPQLFAMADGAADDQYINEGAQEYYYDNAEEAADDAAADDAVANYNYDDQAAAYDDAANYFDDGYSAANPYAEDGSILYWTDFAIFPKRCVNWEGIDQVKFDMYEKSYKHCSDTPMGTYLVPVSIFVNAYLNQLTNNAADSGVDYEVPEVAAAYAQCGMGPKINGYQYYYQVGCSDSNPLALAVNIYEDDTCTTLSDKDGYNDANLQIDITLPFQKCTPCVIWMDKNDDEVDDQYYVNKQTYAPLCMNAWRYKEDCNGSCKRKTAYAEREGWNKADQVLLTILSLFGFGMCISIVSKRQKMSHKDALLEQAAISAAGLQQSHIIGSFLLLILIITVFALLGLKKITWALLLMLNIVLFAYLMKLTVDGSVKETVIGPDGKIVPDVDSDEEEEEDDDDEGDYQNPTLPVRQTELPEIA